MCHVIERPKPNREDFVAHVDVDSALFGGLVVEKEDGALGDACGG